MYLDIQILYPKLDIKLYIDTNIIPKSNNINIINYMDKNNNVQSINNSKLELQIY